jgi:2-dehydro-3-deoxyphosphogluconate aldolase / (4S)-4-hydroxy-2-oxoglutarate aldolase
MGKSEMMMTLRQSGAVAVIRSDNTTNLIEAAKVLKEVGVRFIEFTMTIPGVLKVIEEAAATLADDHVFIGAGSVLGPENTQAALNAGAQYIVAPTFNACVVELCHRHSAPVIPGAFTPQEILTAWEGGADVIKLFPPGGPDYLQCVREPFPQINFISTGGNAGNAGAFIKAGSWAICFGGTPMGKLIAAGDFNRIRENTTELLKVIRAAQKEIS